MVIAGYLYIFGFSFVIFLYSFRGLSGVSFSCLCTLRVSGVTWKACAQKSERVITCKSIFLFLKHFHRFLRCTCSCRESRLSVHDLFSATPLFHLRSHIHTGARPVKPARRWLLSRFPGTNGGLHAFLKGTLTVAIESISVIFSPLRFDCVLVVVALFSLFIFPRIYLSYFL